MNDSITQHATGPAGMSDAADRAAPPARDGVVAQVATLRAAIDRGEGPGVKAEAEALLARVAPADRALVLNVIAHLYGATGEILAFARAAAEARSAAQVHQDPVSEAEAILHSGQALQMVEDHAAAIPLFEEAGQRAAAAGTTRLQARVWRRLGISSSIIGRHAQAIDYLQQSVRALAAPGNEVDWFGARNSLLNAHNRQIEADIPEGPARTEAYRPYLALWDQLAGEAEAAGLARMAAIARGNYAIAQRYVDDFSGALDTLNAVLARYEAFNMRANIAITHNEIGTLLNRMARHHEALDAFGRALAVLGSDGSKREQREAWHGKSLAEEALGDPAAALAALKKVRALEAELTDQEARHAAERGELTLSIRRFSDQWEKLAKEDSLTGLPNRRALEQWLHGALSRAGPGQPVTLLMIDVDHFKLVNDRFTHQIGDRTLQALAELLRINSRYADFPARHGGEEFILALPQTDITIGSDVAKRLKESVAGYAWQGLHDGLIVTISIGVASTSELERPYTAEALIAASDRRLYIAKRTGRNRVVDLG